MKDVTIKCDQCHNAITRDYCPVEYIKVKRGVENSNNVCLTCNPIYDSIQIEDELDFCNVGCMINYFSKYK